MRVRTSAPQPRLGQDRFMPRHRREGGAYGYQWLLISLLFSLMVKDEEALVSNGRCWSCLGRRGDLTI